MSMELHVLSDRMLNSMADWQQSIDAMEFRLKLATDTELVNLNGFLPAQLDGKPTGFECFHDNARETIEFLGESSFDHAWKYAFGFRWVGSRTEELVAVWMAASAYAAAISGIIFDHQEGRAFTPTEARNLVPDIIRDCATMDSIAQKAAEQVLASLKKDQP